MSDIEGKNKKGSHQTNSLQSLMHMINGYIGTGILVMPKAFFDAGLLVGAICTPIIGMLCNRCVHMLVEVNDHICEKLGSPTMDYEEIAEKALSSGPKFWHKFAKWSKFLVMLFLLVTQIGACCAYNLFIAKNIRKFSTNLNLFSNANMAVEYYLAILLPFMILLNLIKSIKHLAYATSVANILQIVMFSIIGYNLFTDLPPVKSRTMVGERIPLFISTTFFTFEGITVVMPIYKAMKNQKTFAHPLGVANIGILVVGIIYFSSGFFGYLKYGDTVDESITLSLPKAPLYESVQLMIAVIMVLSYPLQMYVPIAILWPYLGGRLATAKYAPFTIACAEYLFRATLVTITFALSASIPELDLIIALVGAISSCSIALIMPPVFHTITFYSLRTGNLSRLWLCLKNGFIITFGVVGAFFGAYYSLADIIQVFSQKYS